MPRSWPRPLALPVLISSGLLQTPPSEAALMTNALLRDFGVADAGQGRVSAGTTRETPPLSAHRCARAAMRRVVC